MPPSQEIVPNKSKKLTKAEKHHRHLEACRNYRERNRAALNEKARLRMERLRLSLWVQRNRAADSLVREQRCLADKREFARYGTRSLAQWPRRGDSAHSSSPIPSEPASTTSPESNSMSDQDEQMASVLGIPSPVTPPMSSPRISIPPNDPQPSDQIYRAKPIPLSRVYAFANCAPRYRRKQPSPNADDDDEDRTLPIADYDDDDQLPPSSTSWLDS